MLLAFLFLRVSYTMSKLPTGKQLTRNSTWRSCDVCVNQFAENGGMATGSCTTTMHPYIPHLVQQFLAKHGSAQLQQPPYSPDLTLCDFLLFPRLKKVLKGHQCEAMEDIKTKFNKDTIRHPERGVRKMFPTVAETLGEVCSCRREMCS